MLLITSDPLINGLREVPKRNTGSLPSEVLDLLIPSSVKKQPTQTSQNVSDQEYIVTDSSEEESSDNED